MSAGGERVRDRWRFGSWASTLIVSLVFFGGFQIMCLVLVAASLLGADVGSPYIILVNVWVPLGLLWIWHNNYIEVAADRVRVVGRGKVKIDCLHAEARFTVPAEPAWSGLAFIYCNDGARDTRCWLAGQGQLLVPQKLRAFVSQLDTLGIEYVWAPKFGGGPIGELADFFERSLDSKGHHPN